MRNRSDHPVAPDQLPLAQLVLRRRREMVLSQGEVARLMHKAAEQAGASYCLATRQAVSEYEHGRIPYPHTLRLLASALGVSLEEAQGAADRQRAHARLPGLPARSWGTLRIPGGLRIPPPRGPGAPERSDGLQAPRPRPGSSSPPFPTRSTPGWLSALIQPRRPGRHGKQSVRSASRWRQKFTAPARMRT